MWRRGGLSRGYYHLLACCAHIATEACLATDGIADSFPAAASSRHNRYNLDLGCLSQPKFCNRFMGVKTKGGALKYRKNKSPLPSPPEPRVEVTTLALSIYIASSTGVLFRTAGPRCALLLPLPLHLIRGRPEELSLFGLLSSALTKEGGHRKNGWLKVALVAASRRGGSFRRRPRTHP